MRLGIRTAQLHVVVDLPTLLHLAEHPAELPGFGPLPASVARELAGDTAWRRRSHRGTSLGWHTARARADYQR